VILDTSALVAIALDEPDRPSLLATIGEAQVVGVGAPTLVEAGIVIAARLGDEGQSILAGLVERLGALVIDFGREHWHTAGDAWLRYGKGRHPAGLNLGDCFAYATAKLAGQPLLAIGNDFSRTDLELVPRS
jgi:ribonuclease VapC